MTARPPRLLIIGGTVDARRAAAALAGQGWRVTMSLAGLTAAPRLPRGVEVRRGGFGGAHGLARWIEENGVRLLIDASHPFAARMGHNAHAAANLAKVPLIRLERPPWRPSPADRWITAPSLDAAAAMIPAATRVFAALGSRGLGRLRHRGDLWLSARMLEPPAFRPPPRWRILRGGPSPSAAREAALLAALGSELLVCRNSGGEAARAKITAARLRRLPVLMIERPPRPRAETVTGVQALLRRAGELGSGLNKCMDASVK